MRDDGDPAGVSPVVPDEALRSAMELAVDVAAAGIKLHPPLPFPPALRPLLRQKRLTGAQIGRARAAVDGDETFRAHLADVASPDLVDEVGQVWLRRSAGWEERLHVLLDGAVTDDGGLARREQRRRAAAQEVAERERVDHASTREKLARERERRADVELRLGEAEAREAAVRAEAATLRGQLTAAREALAGARTAVGQARADAASALERAADAEATRDAVLAARAGEPLLAGGGAVDLGEVRRAYDAAMEVLGAAQTAARRIGPAIAAAAAAPAAPWPPPGRAPGKRRPERPRRAPVQIPGGLYGNSPAVAEHLLKVAGIVVLVDGYNVAKLGWPALTLEAQRERTIVTAEDVARRWGTDVTIVFDGADVPGASAPVRRLVRVTFSPAGVLADDVLRAEVAELDHRRAVLVVTSDQAVVNDVRADGANTIASDQFLAVARR